MNYNVWHKVCIQLDKEFYNKMHITWIELVAKNVKTEVPTILSKESKAWEKVWFVTIRKK